MSQVESKRRDPPGWLLGRDPRAKVRSTRAKKNGRSRFPFKRTPAPGRIQMGLLAINTCPKPIWRLVFYCFEDACDVPEFYACVRWHVGVVLDLVEGGDVC